MLHYLLRSQIHTYTRTRVHTRSKVCHHDSYHTAATISNKYKYLPTLIMLSGFCM
jgi:hypothetical protein